jgi:hypothetical protein
MSERMKDLRWPLVTAIVVVAAMFAAFTVTRSDAATGTSSNATPNQTIQSQATPTPTPGDRDGDGRDCPEHDGQGRGFGGGGGEQGSAPQTAPSAPSTSGTEL